MAGEKTEQPTEKKLRDAAKKGQTFKARDLITALMMLSACAYLVFSFSFSAVGNLYRVVIAHHFDLPLHDFMVMLGMTFFRLSLPIIALCVLTTALPSLLMSRFALASESIKIDFSRLNPVEGVKKLFSLRSLKEVARAVIYLLMAAIAIAVFWSQNKVLTFSLLHGKLTDLLTYVPLLFWSLVKCSLGCGLVFYGLDALVEYFLHIKNLKMDKHEVKQEHKEQEGNPEIKQHRRQLQMDFLSEQVKSDVASSSFILANPTHIAIGVYFNLDFSPAPFVSVLETEERARAVIAYAESCGVPVVRDIPLARSLFKQVSRYSFIPVELVDGIYRVLDWLYQVEVAGYDAINDSSASV
jgi:type III secretion YscU/HrpY family protein